MLSITTFCCGTALVCPGIPIKTERIQASPTFWIHLVSACSLIPNPLTKSITVLGFVHLRYSAMPVGSLVHNQPTIHFVPADTVDDPDTPDPTRQSLETLLTVCIHLVSVCSLFPDPVAESKVILGLDRRSDQSPLSEQYEL
jgi:hypothetical protein